MGVRFFCCLPGADGSGAGAASAGVQVLVLVLLVQLVVVVVVVVLLLLLLLMLLLLLLLLLLLHCLQLKGASSPVCAWSPLLGSCLIWDDGHISHFPKLSRSSHPICKRQ